MIVNKDLAIQLEQSEIDCLYARLSAIKEVEGNPMGVEIRTFGNATAFSVRNIPGPSFNTVKGLRDGDEKYVEEIMAFYRDKGIPVRIELTPAHVSTDFLTYVSERGFYQQDFHTALYRTTEGMEREDGSVESITIRKLERDEFDLFAEVYTKGFQMPDFLKRGVMQNNEILYDNPNWHFYIASIGHKPAGIAVLFMKDQVATLAAATTIPIYRNKGIQSAFIKERIYRAGEEGCHVIAGQAKFASISQNNMERADLKIAYTKSIMLNNHLPNN